MLQQQPGLSAVAAATSQSTLMPVQLASHAGVPNLLEHQLLQSELESSLNAAARHADVKRRLAEARASECEQDAAEARAAVTRLKARLDAQDGLEQDVAEARSAAGRLKARLAAAQDERDGLEEALQRERATGSRLRQALQQQQSQQQQQHLGVGAGMASAAAAALWGQSQMPMGSGGGGGGRGMDFMMGMMGSGGADAEMTMVQLRRLQQQVGGAGLWILVMNAMESMVSGLLLQSVAELHLHMQCVGLLMPGRRGVKLPGIFCCIHLNLVHVSRRPHARLP